MLEKLPDSSWSHKTARHLLSRSWMWSSAVDRAQVYELGKKEGVEAAVSFIVDGQDNWDEFPFPEWWDGQDISSGGPTGSPNDSEDRFTAWYANQLLNANPLGAKLFKFFVDHAPVDSRPLLHQNKFIYFFEHFDLCRRHALGNFRDFISELTWDGAMMWMLDMRSSSRGRLNENFGRELLELFTMGVEGGYTEDDVVAVSRAFTGRKTDTQHPQDWPYKPYLNQEVWPTWPPDPEGPSTYYYYIDTLEKTFLGQTLTGFSPDDQDARKDHGDEIIEMIFNHPACGQYLSWKLWRYFVSPNPPMEMMKELGDRWREVHHYEMRPLLKDIFTSAAFYDDSVIGNQIKDGADYFVSCLKSLGVKAPSPTLTFVLLDRLGYNPMYPPSIAGWPEPVGVGNAWIGPEKLLARANMPLLWTQETKQFLPAANDYTKRSIVHEPVPSDFDLHELVPRHLMGRENIGLVIDELNQRLMPMHLISSEQRQLLIELYERDYRLLDDQTLLRELIRMMIALPEFQLQ